jgi:hypothetical protein
LWDCFYNPKVDERFSMPRSVSGVKISPSPLRGEGGVGVTEYFSPSPYFAKASKGRPLSPPLRAVGSYEQEAIEGGEGVFGWILKPRPVGGVIHFVENMQGD